MDVRTDTNSRPVLPASLGEAIATSLSAEQARRVLYSSSGFAFVGGLYGATVASWRYAPAIPIAFHSAVSTGSVAFTFFSLREYLAIPTIMYLRKNGQIPPASLSPRWQRIPESTLAGFGAGALYGGYQFGFSGRILSGGWTFALLALAGQAGLNQANVSRINYINRRRERLSSPSPDQPEVASKPPVFQRVTESLLSVSPIRKVPDDEYVATLKEKIRNAEQEITIVKGQLEDLEKRRQSQDKIV